MSAQIEQPAPAPAPQPVDMPTMRLLRALYCRLESPTCPYSGNRALRDLIGTALRFGGFSFLRRPTLAGRFHPDFWIPTDSNGNGVVVSVLTHGTLAAALRSVDRYIGVPAVVGVLLATTRPWDAGELGPFAHRVMKPVGLTHLTRSVS